MAHSKKKILICANTSWYLTNFRLNLIKFLISHGYQLYSAAPRDEYTHLLEKNVVAHYSLPFSSSSVNPLLELKLIYGFNEMLREIEPDVMLNFTAKPNIYGSLACRWRGIKVINNIAGLGSGFVENSTIIKLVLKNLYRLAFIRADTLMFQNPDDLKYFVSENLVKASQTQLIPGSGVDLKKFSFKPPNRNCKSPFIFLFVGRMLKSKGVIDFLEAARSIISSYPGKARFYLCGSFDVDNKDAVARIEIESYEKLDDIRVLGHVDDISVYIENANCVVLPSYYREGIPRSLLEALAVGRLIITTDMPGCKETVNEQNGWIVQPKDISQLTQAMSSALNLSYSELLQKSTISRKLAESKFDEKLVLEAYLNSIQSLTN